MESETKNVKELNGYRKGQLSGQDRAFVEAQPSDRSIRIADVRENRAIGKNRPIAASRPVKADRQQCSSTGHSLRMKNPASKNLSGAVRGPPGVLYGGNLAAITPVADTGQAEALQSQSGGSIGRAVCVEAGQVPLNVCTGVDRG